MQTLPTPDETYGVTEFLSAAQRGRRGTASSGEAAANRLAQQVKVISAKMQDMDSTLRYGFLNTLYIAADPDCRSQILSLLPK